jgi:hypothetical protein
VNKKVTVPDGRTGTAPVHGFNQLPYLTGRQRKGARTEFYCSTTGSWCSANSARGRNC